MNLDCTAPLAYRSMLVSQDNQLWVWGRNTVNLLLWGKEVEEDRLAEGEAVKLSPVAVPPSKLPCAPEDIRQMAPGFDHVLLVTKNGKAYAWGNNKRGQLGFDPGTITVSSEPTLVEIAGDPKIVSACCGDFISFLVTEEGHVFSFGQSGSRLGHEKIRELSYLPKKISGVSEIVKISTALHTLALTKKGEVFGWGDNSSGQLGLGHVDSVLLPTKIPLEAEISEIFVGGHHSMFLTKKGELFTCGSNNKSQLGLGDASILRVSSPSLLPLKGVVSVSAGWEHSLAFTQEGTLYAWGDNEFYQLGIPIPGTKKKMETRTHPDHVKIESPTPVDFPVADRVVWMGAGTEESMVITQKGNLYTWGNKDNLGHGPGDFEVVSRPKHVRGIKFKLPNAFFEKIWRFIIFWVSLGRRDPESIFSIFPVEIQFHFVDVLLK